MSLKIKILFLLAVSFFIPLSAMSLPATDAGQKQIMYGSTTLKDVRLSQLQVNGNLKFDNIIVDDGVTVNGSASGTSSNFGNLEVNGSLTGVRINARDIIINGSLDCSKLSVKGDLSVKGAAFLKSSNVGGNTQIEGSFRLKSVKLGNISAHTSQAEITNSKIGTIIFQKTTHPQEVLKIRGESAIGNIRFESGQGVVYIEHASKVGEITGATIKRVAKI